jgi:tetratricopeptide (TPR) repeat protein
MGVAILLIAHPITVLLHELGHAIPAILFTRKKVTVYIGSYGETTKSFRFRLGLLEFWIRKSLFWKTGMCSPSSTKMSLFKKVLFILGGPLASLIIAGVTSYFVFRYDMHGALKMIMAFFTLCAIWDFVTNIIPNHVPQILPNGEVCYNDGAKLRQLLGLKTFSKEFEIAAELYDRKDFQRAAPMFVNFLSKGYCIDDVYRLAYTSYMFVKDYSKAYELLKAFERKEQMNSIDYYNFCYVCSFLQLTDEKENYLKRCLDLNPDNPFAQNLVGYDLNKQHKFAEAIPHFDRAIAMEPSFAYAYNNRGHASIELGQIERGLEDINHSLQLDKENSYAYRNLGIYKLKLNQLEEAKLLFLQAKKLDAGTELIEELLAKVKDAA